MELKPLPPPVQTLTLDTTPPSIPKKPPEPSIFTLFPGKPPNRVLGNPFKDADPAILDELRHNSLNDTLNLARAPFTHNSEGPLAFNGTCLGKSITAEVFNSAVTLITVALDHSYYHKDDPTPLSASNWAELSCMLLAAIGRGYTQQYTENENTTLEEIRATAVDPNPLTLKYPTFFHRLGATAKHLQMHLAPDQDNYNEWYTSLVDTFNRKVLRLDGPFGP
jgi:hypothetical protein